MNIGVAAVNISRGWPVLKFGFRLLRQKNKNEVQERAARSFARFFGTSCALTGAAVVVLCVVMGIALLRTAPYDMYGTKRYGKVLGDSVSYTQNVRRTVSLSELGLSDCGLSDGDSVLLFFDRATDELRAAVPQQFYDARFNSGLILMGVTLAVVILVLSAWSMVGQYALGRDFGQYYAICARRRDDSWAADPRSGLYEQIFIASFRERRNPWSRLFMTVIFLTFLLGISVAGAVMFGRVYAFLPDAGLVAFSRLTGTVSALFYVLSLIYIVRTYDYRMHPLYYSGEQLCSTRLLAVNGAGKAGCYTPSGQWLEMQSARIMQEDERIMRVRCSYGGWLKEDNYIARGDAAYDAVKRLAGAGAKRKSPALYAVGMCVILMVYLFFIGLNLRLALVRDHNIISFQTGCNVGQDAGADFFACHAGHFDL